MMRMWAEAEWESSAHGFTHPDERQSRNARRSTVIEAGHGRLRDDRQLTDPSLVHASLPATSTKLSTESVQQRPIVRTVNENVWHASI